MADNGPVPSSGPDFDPAKWVEVADNLGMEVRVADNPDAPGCWILVIGEPRRRKQDAYALLAMLQVADYETAVADYLMTVGRYTELG